MDILYMICGIITHHPTNIYRKQYLLINSEATKYSHRPIIKRFPRPSIFVGKMKYICWKEEEICSIRFKISKYARIKFYFNNENEMKFFLFMNDRKRNSVNLITLNFKRFLLKFSIRKDDDLFVVENILENLNKMYVPFIYDLDGKPYNQKLVNGCVSVDTNKLSRLLGKRKNCEEQKEHDLETPLLKKKKKNFNKNKNGPLSKPLLAPPTPKEKMKCELIAPHTTKIKEGIILPDINTSKYFKAATIRVDDTPIKINKSAYVFNQQQLIPQRATQRLQPLTPKKKRKCKVIIPPTSKIKECITLTTINISKDFKDTTTIVDNTPIKIKKSFDMIEQRQLKPQHSSQSQPIIPKEKRN